MPRRLLKPLCAAALLLAAAAWAAEPAALPVPDSIAIKNVPALPAAVSDDLLAYENIRSASAVDWHPTQRRLLITTRFADVNQLHELKMPLGQRTQLTFFTEPVFGGLYRPNDPERVLFGLNVGGAENFQFYLLDRETGKKTLVTDGEHRFTSPRWSRDGRLLAYVGNPRNGRDFDVYVTEPGKPETTRRAAELTGSWSVLDWSPDGRRLLLIEEISANESYLHQLDLGSGQVTAITPRQPAKSSM